MEKAVLEKALEGMDGDLRFLLEDNGVSELGQAHLGELAGDPARFKNFFEDVADLKETLKKEYNVSASNGLKDRAEVAAVMAAWEAAAAWKKVSDKAAAEDRVLGRVSNIKMKDYNKTKTAFEKEEKRAAPGLGTTTPAPTHLG